MARACHATYQSYRRSKMSTWLRFFKMAANLSFVIYTILKLNVFDFETLPFTIECLQKLHNRSAQTFLHVRGHVPEGAVGYVLST